ncbi:unnamed protein product [Discosporangium mesarthrocarpum]
MNKIERELGMFNDLSPFTGFGDSMLGGLGPFSLGASIDVKEGDDTWTMKVDLPGVEKKDIKVSVDEEGEVLTVQAEKRRERDEKGEEGAYHIMERGYGSVRRSICIPESADRKTIKAESKDGVLTIVMQKKEKKGEVKKQRVIDVQ